MRARGVRSQSSQARITAHSLAARTAYPVLHPCHCRRAQPVARACCAKRAFIAAFNTMKLSIALLASGAAALPPNLQRATQLASAVPKAPIAAAAAVAAGCAGAGPGLSRRPHPARRRPHAPADRRHRGHPRIHDDRRRPGEPEEPGPAMDVERRGRVAGPIARGFPRAQAVGQPSSRSEEARPQHEEEALLGATNRVFHVPVRRPRRPQERGRD